MSSTKTKSRKIGALIAYTTLACSLVSLGVYVYRQQKKSSSPAQRGSDQNSRQSPDGPSQDGRSTEVRFSPQDPWIHGFVFSSSRHEVCLFPERNVASVGSTFCDTALLTPPPPPLPSHSVGHSFSFSSLPACLWLGNRCDL